MVAPLLPIEGITGLRSIILTPSVLAMEFSEAKNCFPSSLPEGEV